MYFSYSLKNEQPPKIKKNRKVMDEKLSLYSALDSPSSFEKL